MSAMHLFKSVQVRHSQRCNDPLLSCWVIAEKSGEICCAHCTCMAGLGEACSHVAAVLFYLETAARINGESTCTQQKCQWAIPAFQKDIPYVPIKDMDFTSAKAKKRKIDNEINSSDCTPMSTHLSSRSESVPVRSPDASELKSFLKKLGNCKSKLAILSLIPDYASRYIPKSQLSNFPTPLQSLYNPKYLEMNYTDLLSACESDILQS